MSGENIYNLLGSSAQAKKEEPIPFNSQSPYTGKYEKHYSEPGKPSYSTFYEQGKEYDGTNPRFYKQRNAVIGKNVGDTVDPSNFMKKGDGIRAIVPPVQKEKLYTKPPVDHGDHPFLGANGDGGAGSGDGKSAGANGNGADGLGNGGRGGGANGGQGTGGSGNMVDAYTGFDDFEHRDVMGVSKSRKNFIASNIVEVSNMVPKNRKDQPQYPTDRRDFGKVPNYLERVKGEVAAEKDFVKAINTQKVEQRDRLYEQYVYRLPPQEQADLLAALQKNLKEKSRALASMPFSLDTISAAKRKAELEKSIKDLSGAIEKIQKEAIFVYRDDPVNVQWTKNAATEEAKRFAANTAAKA